MGDKLLENVPSAIRDLMIELHEMMLVETGAVSYCIVLIICDFLINSGLFYGRAWQLV